MVVFQLSGFHCKGMFQSLTLGRLEAVFVGVGLLMSRMDMGFLVVIVLWAPCPLGFTKHIDLIFLARPPQTRDKS